MDYIRLPIVIAKHIFPPFFDDGHVLAFARKYFDK